MSTYRFHFRMLTIRRLYPKTSKALLVASGGALLSWLVFSVLLSAWSLVDSSNYSHRLWYASSVLILAGATGYVSRELLRLAGLFGRGSSPGAPLTGAPCPVPVRPAPHLVRSAAERLPLERRERIDTISHHPQ